MLQEIDTKGQIDAVPIMVPEYREYGRNVRESAAGVPHDDREIAVGDLAFLVVAAFRRHPHINNVLTHISGANWQRVEQAQRAILNPLTASRDLTPLARNILDLMCADRGVTGRNHEAIFSRSPRQDTESSTGRASDRPCRLSFPGIGARKPAGGGNGRAGLAGVTHRRKPGRTPQHIRADDPHQGHRASAARAGTSRRAQPIETPGLQASPRCVAAKHPSARQADRAIATHTMLRSVMAATVLASKAPPEAT